MVPILDHERLSIGLLVAWDNHTFPCERQQVRKVVSKHPDALELKVRVSARLVHKLTIRSTCVICRRGNEQDTHRFWVILYLGSLWTVRERNSVAAFEYWPKIVVNERSDIMNWNRSKLESFYLSMSHELVSFRQKSETFIYDELAN